MEGRGIPTGDIGIDRDKIWTTGLNTCIFLCIRTETSYIGWHFSSDCMGYGLNMARVKAVLDTIKNVINVFIVKGDDRDDELKLKPNSRTLQYRPELRNNTTQSRDFLLNFLNKYSWFKEAVIEKGVGNYKEFVLFGKGLPKPIYIRNDKLFDDICIVDGGKMT